MMIGWQGSNCLPIRAWIADEASKKLEQYESLIETKATFDRSDLVFRLYWREIK